MAAKSARRPAVVRAAAVAVEAMEGRVLFDASALVVTIPTATLPAAVSDQAAVKGKVVVTLTNSAAAATGKDKVLVSLSAVAADGSDPLATKSLALSLKADAAKTITLPVSIKPGTLADGTYTITAGVGDATGAGSVSATGPTLTVSAPVVTLSATESVAKLPATLASGKKLAAVDKVAIANSGTDASTLPLTVTVYATTDGVAADGVAVGTVTKKAKVAAGRSVAVPVKLSADLPDGTYTLVATVATATGVAATSPADPSTVVVGTGGTTTTPTPTPTPTPTSTSTSATVTTATAQYTYDPLEGENDHATEVDTTISFTNPGPTISGTFTLTLYASDTATGATSAATQIGQIPLTLTAGTGTSTISANFGLTHDYTYSGYSGYIIVDLTAPDGTVTEARYAKEIRFDGLATDG